MSNWTLFSNHGHVLVCLARDPQARLRDVAASVGITERAVQKIVRDLQHGGMISVSKQGRRNQYRIHRKAALRHPLESESRIGGLLDLVNGSDKPSATAKREVSIRPPIEKPVVEKTVEEPKRSKSTEPQSEAELAEAELAAGKSISDIEKQQGSLF